MTVAAQTTDTVLTLTSANLGPFSTVFTYSDPATVMAWLNTGSGWTQLANGAGGFTVAPTGDPTVNGGAVTLSAALLPISGNWSTGTQLAIRRVSPTSQLSALGSAAQFLPTAYEAALDLIVRPLQELWTLLNRALTAPIGEGGLTLPSALNRASKVLAFDSLGYPVAVTPVSAGAAAAFDFSNVVPATGRNALSAQKRLWIDPTEPAYAGGADPTGATDSSAAYAAAITAWYAANGLAEIRWPAGKFKILTPPTITFPVVASGSQVTSAIAAFRMSGAGQDVTVLYFPNGVGSNVVFGSQQHSIEISRMSVTSGAQGAGNAFTFTNTYPYFGTFVAQSDFTDVTFRGDDGYAYSGGASGKYWARAIQDANVSDVVFTNCNFYGNSNGNVGTGVYLDSPGAGTFVPATGGTSSSFTLGSVYTFNDCNFSLLAVGVYYGRNTQTVTLNGCFFGNGQNAVVCPTAIYNNSGQGLIVNDCTFFCTGDTISVQSPINNIQINNNFFAVAASQRGAFVSPGVNLSIIGNQFIPYGNPNTAAAGVELQGLVSGSVQSVDILTPGTGYTNGASFAVSGGGGASFAATIGSINASGGITSVVISNRGTGYSGTVTLTPPGGTGASLRVNLVGTVLGVIDDNTFSSVTNGIILDSYASNVRVGLGNCFTPGMTNNILDGGVSNIANIVHDAAGFRVNKATAKIGYGAGSGAAVTQLTSKSTAVTINNPSGQITTNNAALGAGTEVAFTVNNSLVGLTDVVLVTVGNANYSARIANTAAGSFSIYLKNLTGGSLSDAVSMNFSILANSSS